MSLPPGLQETHTVEIVRVSRGQSSGESTKARQSVATGVSVHIQPFSGSQDDGEVGLDQRGRVRFYLPGGTDVLQGDQLKASATVAWNVEEMEDWSSFGPAHHLEGLAMVTRTVL